MLGDQSLVDPYPASASRCLSNHRGQSSVYSMPQSNKFKPVYTLFQYIIGDGILLSWTGPFGGLRTTQAQTSLHIRAV